MKSQRRFAPTSGEFTPESVARFTGIGKKDKNSKNIFHARGKQVAGRCGS